jgi:hypothetical protein
MCDEYDEDLLENTDWLGEDVPLTESGDPVDEDNMWDGEEDIS